MVLTLEETLKAVKKFQNLVEHVHRPGNNGSFFFFRRFHGVFFVKVTWPMNAK